MLPFLAENKAIGVYDWSGNNPMIPEIWLVPRFLPIHPGKLFL
jgi:achilleol B synthase